MNDTKQQNCENADGESRQVEQIVRRYRKMKCGEIIKPTDEYISVFSNGKFIPVKDCSIGQELLECNVKYYRRPINA